MPSKRTIRYRSKREYHGYPLLVVSCGPDASTGETSGTAQGIVAIGDRAVGILAIGGVTAGVISIGGVAVGLVTVGGVAAGGFVLGGVALGGMAFGGVAIGIAAAGGVAIGVYTTGAHKAAHAVLAAQSNPLALAFLQRWIPGFRRS